VLGTFGNLNCEWEPFFGFPEFWGTVGTWEQWEHGNSGNMGTVGTWEQWEHGNSGNMGTVGTVGTWEQWEHGNMGTGNSKKQCSRHSLNPLGKNN